MGRSDAHQTRAAICGVGLLFGIIFLFAHLPVVLLIVPVAILFLGPRVHQNPKEEKKPWGFFDCIVADPEETHAVWYGMLSVLGIFDISELNELEKANYVEKRHYFWFGEVGLAAILAGTFAIPAGMYLAGRTELPLAFTGTALIFLPLFVFLKVIRPEGGEECIGILRVPPQTDPPGNESERGWGN
ncbi:MAG: hypothetical protein M0R30_02180 [Methanoregula sp.]|jgi:hypothetical protein|uniref:hypothetical protein n=1 Tax=Methanoregula sp. TaxID=2052170 RepID=UPI0025FFD774|nr:hypothetical protein [Methanoregula sp.]MCK9630424.1 hypothetical protein [Methanoregula sp.]